MADAVRAELERGGIEVSEDDSGAETGSDSGNLLARVPGPPEAPVILLCAHLDTVPLAGPVEVVREDERFFNRHDAILGADNKAAVAVFIAVARRLAALGSPVGLELLFTTAEEGSLAGATAFDRERLEAGSGFVFDHASPIGELVVAAPTHYRIDAHLHGVAAHAGVRPEAGRNAIDAAALALSRLSLGRIDAETTANTGRIEGGSAGNVVAEHCRVELEARSVDHDRATALAAEIVDAFTEAGSERECDVETRVAETFRGYRLARTSPPVATAAAALADLAIEARPIATGGASDANVLVARGLPCVNVANGTERNHQPDESVTVAALEAALDLALGIVHHSA